MANSPNLALQYLEEGQNQAEVTVNDALNILDVITQFKALNRTLTTPPGSPSEGDVYIVPSGATGAWSGHTDDIAFYFTTWRFLTPQEGWTARVAPENLFIYFNGTAWVDGYQTLTDSSTINWDADLGTMAQVTLGGNRTFANPTNTYQGQALSVFVIQDGSGNRTAAWGSNFLWPGGPPSLSTGSGDIDLVTFAVGPNNDLYGSFLGDFG